MAINPSNPFSLAARTEDFVDPSANIERLRALTAQPEPTPTSGGRRAPASTTTAPATSDTSVSEASTPPMPVAYDRRDFAGRIKQAQQLYNENAKAADLALLMGQITPLQRRRVDERYRNELGYLNAMASQQESRDRRINELRAKNKNRREIQAQNRAANTPAARAAARRAARDAAADALWDQQWNKWLKSGHEGRVNLPQIAEPVNREMPTMRDILAQSPTGLLMDLASRPEVSTAADRDLYNMNREAAQMPREPVSDRVIREAPAIREQYQSSLPEMASYPEGFVGPPETLVGQNKRLKEEDYRRRDEEKMEEFRERERREVKGGIINRPAWESDPLPPGVSPDDPFAEILQRYRNHQRLVDSYASWDYPEWMLTSDPEIARRFQQHLDWANNSTLRDLMNNSPSRVFRGNIRDEEIAAANRQIDRDEAAGMYDRTVYRGNIEDEEIAAANRQIDADEAAGMYGQRVFRGNVLDEEMKASRQRMGMEAAKYESDFREAEDPVRSLIDPMGRSIPAWADATGPLSDLVRMRRRRDIEQRFGPRPVDIGGEFGPVRPPAAPWMVGGSLGQPF
jgi:hypothetical protein